jgi:hypothetical protein
MSTSDTPAPAEIRYVDTRRGKPPSAALYFDIRLRNLHDEQRWFLLPRSLDGRRDIGRSAGVSSADVYEYGSIETGIVRLGDFHGNGGFSALLLPAGADVIVRRFAVPTMQNLAYTQKVSIPLVIAVQVDINGQRAETWFGGTALTDKRAKVALDEGQKIYAHGGSNTTEWKVTLVDEERFTFEVPIR